VTYRRDQRVAVRAGFLSLGGGVAVPRLRRDAVWTEGAPLLVLCAVVDQLAAPISEHGNRSNTYRVIAKKKIESRGSAGARHQVRQ